MCGGGYLVPCETFVVFIIYFICVCYISCCKKKASKTSCLKNKNIYLSHEKVQEAGFRLAGGSTPHGHSGSLVHSLFFLHHLLGMAQC